MIAAVFLSGVTAATFAASGLFFLKFWSASRDRFFALFAAACFLIAFERVVAFFVHGTREVIRSPAAEASFWVYLIRLLAFLFILLAIYQKNRPQRLR